MIRVRIPEPSRDWDSVNPFVVALAAWKDWAEQLGLVHLRGGSEIDSLEPGQWCIKTYDRSRTQPMLGGRWVCFHESDRTKAMMFKLAWGGR